MKKTLFLISLTTVWLLFLFPLKMMAGGPENVLVVVNLDSPESMAIANHFVQLRKIPSGNVVYLDNIPAKINCSQAEFRDNILLPVIQFINEHKLGNQIDCIAYSAGFPTGVSIKAHVNLLEEKVSDFQKNVFKPRGSINALTFFYRAFVSDDPSYMLMDANWYARRIVRNLLEEPFVGELQQDYEKAISSYKQGEYETAIGRFATIVKDHPKQISARYYLARAMGYNGQEDDALKELKLCVLSGWCYRGLMENDKAFAGFRDDPRFQEIVNSSDRLAYGQLPTRGFDNRIHWAKNGWVNNDQSQGRLFVLSTVLAVTTGRGNTLTEAIAQLKRSVAADGTHPQGTFIFTSNQDIRTKSRAHQFPLAIKELREMGFRAIQIRPVIPENRKNVLGATLGRANLDWPKSRSVFSAGAICDNLTSHGGSMALNATQTPCTHFLAAGAAGASGTVIEPLAIANKFPDAQLHVHYARGCSLAESYYQSVKSPFQLLIVGDPLCRPWGQFPEFSIDGIENGATLNKDFSISLQAKAGSPGIGHYEMYVDGRRSSPITPGKRINVNISRFPDGYHELRVVAYDDTRIQVTASQIIGFFVDLKGKSVSLEIAGNGQYQLARTIRLKAASNCGTTIEIFQNSRRVGVIDGQEGELSLDCSLLGQGPTTLQAIVVENGQRIASNPVDLVILP